jgi:hypothetical protein
MSNLACRAEPGVTPLSLAGAERTIEQVAARFVRTWGFTTVDMVAARFRILKALVEPRAVLARRALERLPDLHWLDPTREWFTLTARPSTMTAAVAKVWATVGDVELDELRLALGKRHSFGGAPWGVIQTFLATLSHTSRVAADGAAACSWEEEVLVAMLRGTGGSDDLRSLRRRALDLGLDPRTLCRTLEASPLFLHTSRGQYRLVGSPVGWPALGGSPAWHSTV